jgi:tRNA A-37 threonylcarbamoyl transferase component Bud32
MAVLSDRRGIVRIDDRYLDGLKAVGLDSFAAFMDFSGGGPVRDKGIRTIERVSLPGARPETLYLKRHRRGSVWEAVKELLRGRRPTSAAAHEWNAISKVRAAGVETMTPVALGERRRFPWRGPSFILTAEVGGRRLEDYVQLLYGKFREKRGIITALADCARRLHGAGLNHRDLYLSHVFLQNSGPALIDLQRVESNARGRNRWVVKDLAALNYSSPAPVVSRADRMRFLHRYLGVTTLDARGKAFLKRIHRKTERIRRHDLKKGNHG